MLHYCIVRVGCFAKHFNTRAIMMRPPCFRIEAQHTIA